MKNLLKIFVVGVFVSSLFFIAPVFASAVSSPALIKLTQEQLAEMNNMPSVEINNIYLPKSVYSSGEEISGTFILKNDRDYNLPDLKYKISLAGNYKNGLAGIVYDSKFYGPIFLKASESKEVKFSYLLPENVAGKDLAIQIQFYTASGLPLAWSDKFLEVTGETSMLNVLDSYIGIGDKKYELQAGPTLSLEKKGILYIEIQNPLNKEQVLSPEIKIYNRTVLGQNLENLKLDEFTIAPKTTKVFQWEISYLDKPGVYEVSADFFDNSGNKVVPTILARYIVGGQIATIQYVSSDKNTLTVGENYNLKIAYSGTPADIDLAPSGNENFLNLSVIVSNENNKKVSEYNTKVDFNKGSSITIPLVASASAQNLLLNIKVTDDNGNIITSYNNEITGNSVPENNNKTILYVIIILLAVIFIAIIVLYSKKNKAMKITMIFMTLFFSFALLAPNSVSANQVFWTGGGNNYPEKVDSIIDAPILSTPGNTLSPGEHFRINLNINTIACSNASQNWEIKRSDIGTLAGSSLYVETYTKTNGFFGGGSHVNEAWFNDQISLANNGNDFIAPSTLGEYYIGIELKVIWGGEWGEIGTIRGYIKFTVGDSIDGPDLVASVPPQDTAVINEPINFTSIIKNQGDATTGNSFYNLFQTKNILNGVTTIYSPTSSSVLMSVLGSNTTDLATSVPYTFTSVSSSTYGNINQYFVRACADDNASWVGTITESDETNNCSGWRNVSVINQGDGVWSPWSCGQCSVQCGGGTKTCIRDCLPLNSGKTCPKDDGTWGLTDTMSPSPSCNLGACGENTLGITFTAIPTRIFKGMSSTLTWTSDANNCTAVTGPGFGTWSTGNGNPKNGNTAVSPTITTTYKISCKKGNTTEFKEATVTVGGIKIIET